MEGGRHVLDKELVDPVYGMAAIARPMAKLDGGTHTSTTRNTVHSFPRNLLLSGYTDSEQSPDCRLKKPEQMAVRDGVLSWS